MVHKDEKNIQPENANESNKKVPVNCFRLSTQTPSSNITNTTEKDTKGINPQEKENGQRDNNK